ncbi:hypothetical protein [Qipengyuania sphaerica]|uniref:hypothetical protein n=1 Tax=Qipengyuania sphaerica TaxID=2867243 RepID=UPI001C86E72C|nr:hypothetical protein [Qipengyuania sphaerica]MBX7541732.1 hypothetical protein [Qipengyuania sphaerica]
MPHIKNLAAAPAMIAALSLTAAPAYAAEMPLPATSPSYAGADVVQQIEEAGKAEHRRYHRYRYRRGPGLGDVLAGVLIVGAIAHVAKAASRDDRRYRDRDYRRDVRYDDTRGIDRAIEMCVDAVDRERRVETVDRVDRTARGWMVEGTVSRGDGFTCRIDNSGRVTDIDFGGRGARYEDDDRDYDDRYEDIRYENDQGENEQGGDDGRQWDDDRYASEWSRVDSEAPAETAQAEQPSYPGGPVETDEEIDGDLEIGTGYPGAGA